MTTLYGKYILLVLAILCTQCVNAQQAKAVAKKTGTTLSKKKITEQQAKRIHEAQLAREGKTGTRRAYKRSDIEKILHTEQDGWAANTAYEREGNSPGPVSVMVKKQNQAKKEPDVAVINTPREPKFIEGIVLERDRPQP